MAVLQFGFEGSPENSNRPNNIQADQVVYTGTHDNDTTASWGLSPPKEFSIMEGKSVCQTLINIALNCNSGMAIIPLQDIMELGTSARMNAPGTTFGNWKWQFQWQDLPSFNLSPPSSSS
jgi:4-alpha-glucanotransferase